MKFTHNPVYNKNLGSSAAKSIFIAILMISMSLSMGFMGDNNPPWSTESAINNFDDSTDIMQTSGSSPSISYSATTLGLERDVSMTALTPVNSGGALELESQFLSSIDSGNAHPSHLPLIQMAIATYLCMILRMGI